MRGAHQMLPDPDWKAEGQRGARARSSRGNNDGDNQDGDMFKEESNREETNMKQAQPGASVALGVEYVQY